MSLIIFAHANSFPASTYRVMFRSLRARGYTVKAPPLLGHDPAYPVSNNWPRLVQQLADFAAGEIAKAQQPAVLAGHSLGGLLSVMAAARHPTLGGHGLAAVVLLDSPLVNGWKASALKLAKSAGFVGSVSPARVSHKRRTTWPSRQVALESFQAKKAFARWEPQVLQDYIDHGMVVEPGPAGGQAEGLTEGPCSLAFSRDVETAIYNTVPDNLERLFKRHPLQCPAAFIGGKHSREMEQVGMVLTEKVCKNRITLMEGSHLFPMEHPLATAAAIDAAIRAARRP